MSKAREGDAMMRSCPHALPGPSDSDLERAAGGDVAAKRRVVVQRSKKKKRDAEIALWEE